MRWFISSCVLTIAALIAADCWAEAAVAEPALPTDIAPLPPALALRMKELVKEAEDQRGLPFKAQVPCGSLGEETLRKKMVEAFHEELPADKIVPLEAALKIFSLIPAEMDLGKYYPELLTSQIGGFYDPRKKYLVIVQREGGLLGKEMEKQYGAAMARRMEETVLVHELTHAIQDQHFDLKKFTSTDPLSDEGAAHLALVEGDATLTMYDFFAGMKLETFPGLEQIINTLSKDPRQLMEMSPDMPGAKEMADAPAYFRDNLLFSYMQGYTFCISVKKLGGQSLLDYAFAKDPPRSTEQILHPEKWHTKRDDPVAIEMPDLSTKLPGWKKLSEGQLGEQTIRILLREWDKDDSLAETAAAGWGGDRFSVYGKDGKYILAWITEWDTPRDRNEFRDAFQKNAERFAAGHWASTDVGDTRTVLVGNAGLLEHDASELLLKAKAMRPENKNIDILAITGHKAGDPPRDDFDLSTLLNSPDIKKMAERLTRKADDATPSDGAKGPLEGIDIGKLMEDPNVQAMMKNMLQQERPAGNTSEDKRTYTNEQLGFRIKAPESEKEWTIDPKPSVPMASVVICDPAKAVQVAVVNQTMPMAVPMEMLASMLEMGPKMSVPGYKKISEGEVKSGDQTGHEIQFEGEQAGQKIRSTIRVFVSGNNMLMITAMAPKDEWPKNEKAIKETLDSFEFMEKTEKVEKKSEPQHP